jgi:peptide/nickel transport system substrate-binding protein
MPPRFLVFLPIVLLLSMIGLARAETSYGLAMHGDPALGRDFQHFTYVNPEAPKGGRIDYGVQGTFDSLNPFIVQGDAARGLFDQALGHNVFESLLARSRDEAFTLYPLIADSVKTDADRTFVEFTIDPDARFSDGEPITRDDVIFSMKLLKAKARPLYQRWIGEVTNMEKTGERGIRFDLAKDAGRELPLLLGLLPILPEHATNAADFDKSTLKPQIGSGPYVIERVDPGALVILKRNPDYWATDKPSKRGFDNYDEIRINYFRDPNTMFEAFKKGLLDVFVETDPARWTTGYDFPAVTSGQIERDSFQNGLPSGMYGFVFNTRRKVFQNHDVRAALADTFDFEWVNRNLFNGVYQRTRSFFDGSELSADGHPASQEELAFLNTLKQKIAPALLKGNWKPPISDGSGHDRRFLRIGYDALVKAGYRITDRKMVGPGGRPLTFEILLKDNAGQQLAIAWQRTLARIGIDAQIRSVDAAQYQQRLQTYDYDVIIQSYYSSLSPGSEQIGRWGSASRNLEGTYNFAGVADPDVDTAIQALLNARTHDEFVNAVRAYDRVLLNGAYVVPLFHQSEQWVAHWKRIAHPAKVPVYGYQFDTWWADK